MNYPTLRMKFALAANDGGAWGDDPVAGSATPVLRSTEITLDGRIQPDMPALRNLSSRERKSTTLRVGDILVVKSSGSDAHLGKSGWVDERCAGMSFSNFIQRLRTSREFSPRYIWYFMNCSAMKEQVRTLSSTTTGLQNLSGSLITEIEVPRPPLDEQRRIADFLDAETGRLDQLCAHRNKQIQLLEDTACSRAFDAVRGVNEPGQRKDSGLDWLGDVPADWRLGAVSHYFEVELGKMLNQERVTGSHVRPYLRVANVQWDNIDLSELASMNFPPEEQARYRLKPGDLLVNEGGSWPGRAAIWRGEIPEMYYQKALHRIRPRGQELTRWLYYCLVVAERLRVFQAQGNTSTMTHLTREQLKPQRFPFPHPASQHRIVAELDRKAEHDSRVRRLLDEQLALLSERRRALITAAVTGQIDVTTARPPLPSPGGVSA